MRPTGEGVPQWFPVRAARRHAADGAQGRVSWRCAASGELREREEAGGVRGSAETRSPATTRNWRRRRARPSPCPVHADIGMEMFLSTQSSKSKTVRVTRCQIKSTTTLQNIVFLKSKLSLFKNFIEHFWSKRKTRFWGFKPNGIETRKFSEIGTGQVHLFWVFLEKEN